MKIIYQKLGILIAFVVLIIALFLFCFWQNNSIVTTKSLYYNTKIPEAFNNFTIVHISDLHNKMFGEEQLNILNKVRDMAPDIIFITGDLIDRRKYDLDAAMTFVLGALEIAPIYYVSGNHEALSGKFPLIQEQLLEAGVNILDNCQVEIRKDNSSIEILGLRDPSFMVYDYLEDNTESQVEKTLKQWSNNDKFKILLSHRPELFPLYSENKMDLIFTGHAHGGQFRIPGLGGLIAPQQGFFPKYTSGSYVEGLYTMFVRRGLGNSLMPIRIFNRPEIVVVKLKTE
ncbi:MAG: metallophosphoesterase [Clostridiales bacterium]